MKLTTLPELLRRRADTAQDALAIGFHNGQSLTFGEWYRGAGLVAHQLSEAGVRKGDRIGLVFPREFSLEFAVSFMGVILSGGIAVPLDFFYPGDISPSVVHSGTCGILTPDPAAVTGVPQGVWVSAPTIFSLSTNAEIVFADPDPTDIAYINYTPVTTGYPKAIAVPHGDLVDSIEFYSGGRDSWLESMNRDRCVLFGYSMSFLSGIDVMLTMTLIGPTREPSLLLTHERSLKAVCDVIAERKLSYWIMGPAAEQLLTDRLYEEYDLSSVRVISVGGTPLEPMVLEELQAIFPEAKIYIWYSQLEALPAGTSAEYTPERATSAGRTVRPGTKVAALDDEGHVVPSGQVGEVCFRQQITPPRSYWNDPERASVVFRDGWVHTQDFGYLDSDGYLYLVAGGREVRSQADIVNPTAEIESVLMGHPEVGEAAVCSFLGRAGEQLGACVVLKGTVSEDSLASFMLDRLPRTKVPRAILFVERLPRDAQGRIERDLLSKLLSEHSDRLASQANEVRA